MKKDIAYYLSRGCDSAMAAYFASGRKQITQVVPNDDYTLTLTFDNGEKRLYNMAPSIREGTVLAPLRDLGVFRRAFLDDVHAVCWDIDPTVDSNVVWNNRVDLCPDSCYVDSVPLGGSPHA